ncbi:MAG: carbonic anhydrase [Magnetococcales bacterium]|nr:carbonic anhydrase [Magnetococcales bacterium]MBF0322545.1 carbonic anhydrase [Magnetococcales bacterium]
MIPTKLLDGYKRFISGYFSHNQAALHKLIEGQAPEVAIVACCDARVDPAFIFDVSPGDIFVIRNVANLVPPFEAEGHYHGTSAALEFAVTKLLVKHIVILAHARCGGIQTLLDKDDNVPSDFLGKWMSIARKARESVLQHNPTMSGQERARACEKAAALHSRGNLMTFPWVAARVKQGTLTLHAWYYDLENGSLEQL